MSALTDLFTAMANKIRSKTGTATTYTPAEMVSDGIDDVYDAGYAAGGGGATGTPITPSNSSPASMTSGTTYEAQANGYAIASYNSVTPSNSSPVSLSDGSIYKMTGSGKAVASVTDITPSNSSPAAMTSGAVYKAGGGGYAIESYQSKTPTQPGTAFNSGMVKMSAAGYAYTDQAEQVNPTPGGVEFTYGLKIMNSNGFAFSTLPRGGFSETTLWTNSSPTSSFAAQDVTLSQSFTNFDYIKINWRATKSNTTAASMIVPPSVLQNSSATANSNNVEFGTHTGSTVRARSIRYSSNTKLSISTAYNVNTSGNSTDYAIPTSIVGLKFTP